MNTEAIQEMTAALQQSIRKIEELESKNEALGKEVNYLQGKVEAYKNQVKIKILTEQLQEKISSAGLQEPHLNNIQMNQIQTIP